MNNKSGKNSFYVRYIKRILDILFSLLALLFLGIPMLIVAFLIKKDMGSPVLFKQNRIGKDNKEFLANKFLTTTKWLSNDYFSEGQKALKAA